jgi:hypothetical protein
MNTIITKSCTGCKEIKPLEDYYRSVNRSDGRLAYCKNCEITRKKLPRTKIRNKERYDKDPNKVINSTKKWQSKNPKHVREYYWQKQNIKLLNNTFFTYEKYQEELVKCNNKCMVCERHQDILKDFLVVDHDHATGIYRGILCKKCNLLLGKLKKNTLLIEKMNEYLNK